MPPNDKSRLPGKETAPAKNNSDTLSVRQAPALLSELDAMAEQLHGYVAVQVAVDDDNHRRTYHYRSAAAAERAVKRAKDRGRRCHVSLVQMIPIGVVVGLGGLSVAMKKSPLVARLRSPLVAR